MKDLLHRDDSNKLKLTEIDIEKIDENIDQDDIVYLSEKVRPNMLGAFFEHVENVGTISIKPYGNCSSCKESRIKKHYKNGKYDENAKFYKSRLSDIFIPTIIIDLPLGEYYISIV